MSEQIVVTPKVGAIHTTLLTAGKYCEKDIFVDLYPVVAHEKEASFAAGYKNGKDEAFDILWNAIQDGGNRTDYARAFSGQYWTDATYKPNYVPAPVNATNMYNSAQITGRVDVDTSKCTAMNAMFGASAITSIGTIDTRNVSELAGVFGYMTKLLNIDLLILKENGTQTFLSSCFAGTNALKNITIQGTIGTTLNLESCFRLTRASIESIIGALSDTATGQKLTLAYAARRDAFPGEDGAAAWNALKASKGNWDIYLAGEPTL